MNNFIQNYEIILKNLNELHLEFPVFKQIRKPKLSNLELIAMTLTSEYMGIDSESQLFRVISSTYLENKIERSVFNRRRRRIFHLIN